MENNFNYDSAPGSYAHCFNHQCVRSNKCMRHLVALHCDSRRSTICTVNSAWIPEDTSNCTLFKPIRKIRLAWGIRDLLKNTPYQDAKTLKAQMLNYFGRTHYYRLFRKEHGLTPEQQNFVRQLFRNKGIKEEPAFESYTEDYQWY